MSESYDVTTFSNPIKDAGVDWITVTSDDPRSVELLQGHSFMWLAEEEKRGCKIRPWSMSGYEGFHCGAVSFGELRGRWLLRLSSHMAHEHWSTALKLSSNCSRIDLQVTVAEIPHAQHLIQRHFKQAKRHFKSWRKPPAVNLWKCSDRSATLYLNKRVSEQFGRIYDKERESRDQHYARCVRYEVEFKDELAHLVSSHLIGADDPHVATVARVHRFFTERGIVPLFSSSSITPIVVHAPTSDVERSLRWLAATVRSSVQDCVRAGRLEDVCKVLGLPAIAGGGDRATQSLLGKEGTLR